MQKNKEIEIILESISETIQRYKIANFDNLGIDIMDWNAEDITDIFADIDNEHWWRTLFYAIHDKIEKNLPDTNCGNCADVLCWDYGKLQKSCDDYKPESPDEY